MISSLSHVRMDSTVSSTSPWSIFNYLPFFIRKPLQIVGWLGSILYNGFKHPFEAKIKSDGKGGGEIKINTFPDGFQPEPEVEARIIKNAFNFERKFGGTTKNCTETVIDKVSGKEKDLPAGTIENAFNNRYENDGDHDGTKFEFTRE